MNTGHIKSYAPRARNDFIAAMTKQAAKYGITEKAIEPAEIKGDLLVIGGKPFPIALARPREALIRKIKQTSFGQVMEQVAYSWFNRLCAIRYMELADYLGHGRRVLSHPQQQNGFDAQGRANGTGSRTLRAPEILEECLDLDLAGLDKNKARQLKLDGNKDEALYRLLLLAQCHSLHDAMPFLFEPVDDETELLLPENLIKTDSLIRDLVDSIPEQDWANIEIIGWLYQFYISEKKDQVIGKVVASEDIPAATQLFTPNWIVKYMVQNSLGAQWLATYPDSPLKGKMEYYIEPAEQTDDVNVQLKEITPAELNPEELTLIDPASGSGHILVEAYDLFKAIYLERGYRQRDIAGLILEKNLFGLDIDERAAQLTGFALMMKGRADDRRLFERRVNLNVMALVDSTEFDAEVLAEGVALVTDYGLEFGDLTELKRLFEHATTFGSLLQVPEGLVKKLAALIQLSGTTSADMFVAEELKHLEPLVQQSKLLSAQYDAVVANPPYMGAKYQTPSLKKFAIDNFKDSKTDFFAMFIERVIALTSLQGRVGIVAPYVWMFLSSFERFRERIVEETSIMSLIQLEYNAFEPAVIPVATFSLKRCRVPSFTGSYIKLSEFKGHQNQAPRTLEAINNHECGWFYRAKSDEFKKIPGSPVAYWIRNTLPFDGPSILNEFESGGRTKTHGNELYIRFWWETEALSPTWVPYTNGGAFRKYAGNDLQVVNWSNEARSFYDSHGGLYAKKYWNKEGITWGLITSAITSFRIKTSDSHYSSGSPTIFAGSYRCDEVVLGFLNSPVAYSYLKAMNPTLNTVVSDVLGLPLPSGAKFLDVAVNVKCLLDSGVSDWDTYERSREFQSLPILPVAPDRIPTLESSYTTWITQNRNIVVETKRLEEENNRLFIDAYGLADELTPDVPIKQITLTVNPAYRYGGKLREEQLWTRFREDTMEELVSYAIGCMMGRYSLDTPGLIYANSGNEGFDPDRYTTFPGDDDGIIPLTDTEWFDDDAANRLEEFISVAWDKTHLEQNLNFLADNLSPKKGEGSRDTIRRYLSDKFFKDHLKTYKKRPIYWLFSSGKEKAFQCLVYLHRYNEGTLSRLRTEYVIPLTSKLATHVSKLEKDKDASATTAEVKKLEREIARLHKQQAELSNFDEKLRHYADQRIHLDLDDGVKVNYGKFGGLLAEVKHVHGKQPDS